MLGIFLIFSMAVKALVGSLVRSLITKSNRPVTGVADSTLGMCSIWEIVCTLSFAFGEYVARLFVSRHFFLPWRASMD